MFEKNDKRRIYWLMDNYLSGNINATTFCDEFYYSYNLEIKDSTLDKDEKQYFSILDEVVSRFSQFEEDLEKYKGVYYSEEELKKQIYDTQKHLKKS